MKLTSTLVLLLVSVSSFSQTVSGIVTDEDQRGLPAVLVINVQSGEKSYTDMNGAFTVKALPENELRFVREGFERSSEIIQPHHFGISISISLIRPVFEIQEVEIPAVRLSGDLAKDSRNVTKTDKVAQLQANIGLPSPPEKPREKAADLKKDVLLPLISLRVSPKAIYDLISGDSRRMKSEYRYEDMQDNIAWIRDRVSDEYFLEMGISVNHVPAFIEFSMGKIPEIGQAVKQKNLSKVLFSLEITAAEFAARINKSSEN